MMDNVKRTSNVKRTLPNIKSSYYTGYEDLDEILTELYARQVLQERDREDTHSTIVHQDHMLLMGKKRDERKEVEVNGV